MKKHQVRVTRGFGLLFDLRGRLVGTAYDSRLPGPDPDLDELVAKAGLKPISAALTSYRPRTNKPGRTTPKKPKRRYRNEVLIQVPNTEKPGGLDGTRLTRPATEPQVRARAGTRRHGRKGTLNPQVLGSSPRGVQRKALVSTPDRGLLGSHRCSSRRQSSES